MAHFLVSTQSLQVLTSDEGVLALLGYYSHEIIGQSIFSFTGKHSDARMLQEAVESIQSDKMQLVLYDASGGDRRMIVSCSPADDQHCCLLTIYPSEAITLPEAFADCPLARTLISADAPHAIHMVNNAFLDRFACSRSEALGRPMHHFHGDASHDLANHDLANLAVTALSDTGPDTAWFALYRAALDGRVAHRLSISSDARGEASGCGSDEVACVPVVEAPNGRIRHLLVTFGDVQSLQGGGGACEPTRNRLAAPCASRAPGRHVRRKAAATTADRSSSFVCPRSTILPRRKPRTAGAQASIDGAPPQPVAVTRELLGALAHLPLHEAAASAGVSATAFKKACRKLGVRRWVYSRRRRPEPQGTIPNACADVGGAADMDCCTDFDEGRGPGSSPGEPETGLSPGDVWSAEEADIWHSPSAADAAAPDSTAWCVSVDTDSECCGRGLGSAWGPFLEGPVVDDALVRDMLGASWPLQA